MNIKTNIQYRYSRCFYLALMFNFFDRRPHNDTWKFFVCKQKNINFFLTRDCDWFLSLPIISYAMVMLHKNPKRTCINTSEHLTSESCNDICKSRQCGTEDDIRMRCFHVLAWTFHGQLCQNLKNFLISGLTHFRSHLFTSKFVKLYSTHRENYFSYYSSIHTNCEGRKKIIT